jgi:hypothetical protein
MKKPRQLYPVFEWPLERSEEQYNNQVQLQHIAEKMKQLGVRVDTQKALEHKRLADSRSLQFSEIFLELTGLPREALGKAGTGVTKAVKDWFREAGAPDVVFDKDSGKPQLNAIALVCWASDFPGAAFAEPAAALLGLRKAKVSGRFAEAYYTVASRFGGRIHFDANPMGTKGLRWSASAQFRWRDENGEVVEYSLNCQNIPKAKKSFEFSKYGKLKLMDSLRDCFIADDGCDLIQLDYEGAEAALIAYISGDKALLEWMDKGYDVHTENARVMFLEAGIPPDMRKIPSGHPLEAFRVAAKPALYGGAYQFPSTSGRKPKPMHEVYATLFKTWKALWPELSETAFGKAVERFWDAHGDIRGWQLTMGDDLERDGFIALPQTGRRLYLPNSMKGKNGMLNYKFQSGIAYLINRAIPVIADDCDWKPSGTAVLLQVHDELVLQAPKDVAREFGLSAAAEMSRPADWSGVIQGVPAWPALGPNWASCKDVDK